MKIVCIIPIVVKYNLFALSVLIGMGFTERTQAQCGTLLTEYKLASAGASKCGLPENTGHISTPPKYYLKIQTVSTEFASGNFNNTYLDQVDIFMPTGSINTISTMKYNRVDCSQQITYSGNATFKETSILSEGGPTPPPYTLKGSAIMDSTGSWNDIDGTSVLYYTTDIISGNDGYWLASETCNTTESTTSTLATSKQTCTAAFYDYDYGTWSSDVTTTMTLSDEYTDSALRDKAMSLIPAYPAVWTTNLLNIKSFGSAFDTLDSNHYSTECGSMIYRLHLMDCIKDAIYTIEWDEITTFPDNTPPLTTHIKENVTGNGDPINGVYTSAHSVDVPSQPSSVEVSAWTATITSSGGN